MSVREIARRAGVSSATVSRAFNDRQSVRPETLKKVLQCYSELGRKPRKYRRQQTKIRGGKGRMAQKRVFFLFPSPEHTVSSDAHRLLEGATIEAKRQGATMMIGYLSDPDCMPLSENEQNPDGLLIFGKSVSQNHAALLHDIPTVWVYSGEMLSWGDRIQPDHFLIGVKSLRYFADKGLTCVCVVTDHTDNCTEYGGQRLSGFQAAASQYGIKCHVLRGEFDYRKDGEATAQKYSRQVVDKFLTLDPRPQGIFVANLLGACIHGVLISCGMIPMKDVIMIAGDKTLVPKYLDPLPVTIDVHVKEAGSMATKMLLWRMENPDALQIRYLTQADLVLP